MVFNLDINQISNFIADPTNFAGYSYEDDIVILGDISSGDTTSINAELLRSVKAKTKGTLNASNITNITGDNADVSELISDSNVILAPNSSIGITRSELTNLNIAGSSMTVIAAEPDTDTVVDASASAQSVLVTTIPMFEAAGSADSGALTTVNAAVVLVEEVSDGVIAAGMDQDDPLLEFYMPGILPR